MAKDFLKKNNIQFENIDVGINREAGREMMDKSGQMGVPVIVVDGQVIIGFDRARLQALLAGGNGHRRLSFGLKIADAGAKARPVGALVGAVAPGSLGEKAGLKAGDIVTDINTRRVSNAVEMEKALAGLKPGGIMTVLFRRGDKPRKSEIVL